MKRIIRTDGKELCLVDDVRYIKRSSYGVFVQAPEAEAIGIVANEKVYNLLGHSDIEGVDTVIVSEASTAEEITAQQTVSGITFVLLTEAGTIDETTATEHIDLFEDWVPNKAYAVGKIVKHGAKLYKCVQAHHSQDDWSPDVAQSLWAQIGDPREEYPQWAQPIGAHDAYDKGAKVSHNGKKWISDIDNNVWEPGVYGWTEVTE